MKTDITNHYLTTLISALINSTESAYSPWLPSTRYLDGARVRAENRLYIAVSTGVSSTVAPTHNSGRALDGTVTWIYVMTVQPPQALGANLYLGIGHPAEWKDEPTPDDIGINTNARALEDLMAAVRLGRRDLALGAVRQEWTTATVFPQWPDAMSYVNVGTALYRCLSNNVGATSTVAPSGTSLTPFETVDGYVWKFLGSVSGNLDTQFGTDEVFAVNPLYANDNSNRWLVQTVAKSGEISGYNVLHQHGTFVSPSVSYVTSTGAGAVARVDLNGSNAIRRIVPTGLGSGYKTGTRVLIKNAAAAGSGAVVSATTLGGEISAVNIDVQGNGYTGGAIAIVDGDGTGAEVTLTVTSGHVTAATIVDGGTGYTHATIHVLPGTSGAVAEAILSPQGGHGKDILKEIPINHLLINRRLTALDSGYVPNGEFRQITLLTGVQSVSGTGDILVGPAHPSPGTRDAASLGNTRVLYVSNLTAVEHSSAQDEEIKLALKIE